MSEARYHQSLSKEGKEEELIKKERRLILGPAGSGKTHLVLASLSHHLKERGPEGALILLPTAGQAEHVKDLLLSHWGLEGLLEERVTNFSSLARYSFRLAGGGRELSPGLKYFLLAEMIQELELPFLTALRESPGLVEAFSCAIKEIKENCLSPQELASLMERSRLLSGLGPRDIYQALAQLYGLYQELLSQAGLYDAEELLAHLAKKLEQGNSPFSSLELLIIDGFSDFTPLEWKVVQRLVAGSLSTLVTLPRDEKRSELFQASRRTREVFRSLGFKEEWLARGRRESAPDLRQVEAAIFSQDSSPVCWDGAVKVIEAADLLNEMEEVARQIKVLVKEGGYRYKDIGVVCRQMSFYRSLLAGVFLRQGIPFRIYGPRPLKESRLVGQLLGLADLLAAELHPARLLQVLKFSFLDFPKEEVEAWEEPLIKEGVALSWARLRQEATTRGWLRPLVAARRLVARDRPPAFYPRFYRWLAGKFVRLGLSDLPLSQPEEAILREEGAALASLLNLVEELRQNEQRRGMASLPLARFQAWLAQAASLATYQPKDLRRDVVNVVDAFQARQWELPVLFVVGLTEGEFPPKMRESLFFNDRERERLNRFGARFISSEAIHAEERFLFYSSLTRAREKLFLTFPAANGKGERNLPSFYLEELKALFSLEDQEAMTRRKSLGESVPSLEEAVDEEELAQAACQAVCGPADSELAPVAAYLWNHLRQPARQLEGWRPFTSGLSWRLARRQAVAELAKRMNCFSATQLAEYAQCPFRHFAGYVLKLKELPELKEITLDARLAGKIVHAALKRYFSSRGQEEMVSIFQQVFEHYTRGMTLSMVEISLREAMLGDLARFVPDEERHLAGSPFVPRHFELAFGMDDKSPVVLEDESLGRAEIWGKIDRVDVAEIEERNLGLVVDYKYSRARKRFRTPEQMEEDSQLQLVLYLKALSQVEGLEPVGAFLYALRDLTRQGLVDLDVWKRFFPEREPPPGTCGIGQEELARFAGEVVKLALGYVAGIRRGDIQVRPRDLNRCGPGNCPFSWVCRYEKWWA